MKTDSKIHFAGMSAVLLASVLLPLPGKDGRLLHIPSFCPFYQWTGLPCPGCGLTRAFVCIGHGQWAASLHWHPLGLIIYSVCVLWWIRAAWSMASGRDLRKWTLPPALPWAALAIVFLTGGARIGWLLVHHTHWVERIGCG